MSQTVLQLITIITVFICEDANVTHSILMAKNKLEGYYSDESGVQC